MTNFVVCVLVIGGVFAGLIACAAHVGRWP